MLVYVLSVVNLVLLLTLAAPLVYIHHLKGQIKELTDLVGDHVADQFLLNETRQELAETKMQLELSRAGK